MSRGSGNRRGGYILLGYEVLRLSHWLAEQLVSPVGRFRPGAYPNPYAKMIMKSKHDFTELSWILVAAVASMDRWN